ncbi:hypothetical protein HDU81_009146 [Chytriomyces hyalinus]|nr:hypothetical protein HDU81_009146 [Chytriomyces hyalinus]
MANNSAIAARLKCTPLSTKNPCGPAFAGWPILIDPESQFGFSSEESFASSVSSVGDPSLFVGGERGCSPSDALNQAVQTMRFQASFACVNAVQNALSGFMNTVPKMCDPGPVSDAGAVIMCPSLCTTATTTYASVFQSAQCTPNSSWLAGKLGTRTSACDTMSSVIQSPMKNQHCLVGIASDLKYCGFASKSSGDAFCAANPAEDCCRFPDSGFDGYKVFDGTQFVYPVALKAVGSGSTTGTSGKGPDGDYASDGKAPVAIIGGVLGGVFGLVGIVLLVWIFHCRRARRNSGMGFTATQLPENELTLPRHNLELKTKSNSSSPIPPPSPHIAASLSRPKLAATTTTTTTKHEIVKVIHSYAPAAVDELDLVEGDDLILIKRFDDGWAVGMQPVSGRQGVFPLICVATSTAATTVKDKGGFIDTTRLSKRMSSVASRSSSPLNPGQTKEKVPVLFGYEALQEDELTLVPGDELIIVKRFDDGWGVGLIPATGMKGAFPLVCVTGGDGAVAGKTASIISKRTSSFIF